MLVGRDCYFASADFRCNTRAEDSHTREPVDHGHGHGGGPGEGDEDDGDAGDFTGLGVTREVLMRAIATARAMGRGGQTGNTNTTTNNGRGGGGGNAAALQDGFISPVPEDPHLRRVALQQRQQFNLDAPLPIDFDHTAPLPPLTDPGYVEAWRNQRRFAHQNRRRIEPRDPPADDVHIPRLGLQLDNRAPPVAPSGRAIPVAPPAAESNGSLSRFARLFGRAAAPLERLGPTGDRTGSALWGPAAPPVIESQNMTSGAFAPSLMRMTGDAQGQSRHAAAEQDPSLAQQSGGGVGSRRTMFFRAAPSAGPSAGVPDGLVQATH